MRLTDYLEKHGKSIAAFGREIGANRSTAHNLCTGRRKPSPDLVLRIEAASGGAVTFHDFYPPLPQNTLALP